MRSRVAGVVYSVLTVAFGLFALLIFVTKFSYWPALMYAAVFALGAVVSARLARESFATAAERARLRALANELEGVSSRR